MFVQNTANGRITEFTKYADILENNIKINQLNVSSLERQLMIVNRGSRRRIKNNHKMRLEKFKAQ